jgi:3D (Asp-Asp-Asp) domain-containing protein/peptidoglycan hydrolase CwlO-like protein
VRASCLSRPARCALAGLALSLAFLAAGGARADDPAGKADTLRSANAGLATKSQQVLLQLYSLETRLRQSELRIDALTARSAELEREQASAEQQLEVARDNMAAAHSQLGQRLRQLYVEGDVDPLAVLLGAESLDDALSALDGLNRLAEQDKDIIAQLTRAKEALRTAVARLASRRAEVRVAAAEAKAAHAYLVRTQARQAAYLAGLRRQQELNRTQIGNLSAQAAASEERSEELTSSSGGGGAQPTPPPPPPPPPAGGRTMTVSSTGYCLRGTTATGIPVGWGVIAVDPTVIPLGTRMSVPGYGDGVAADTGAAVKGANIDLWFPTCARALAWGRVTVTITFR